MLLLVIMIKDYMKKILPILFMVYTPLFSMQDNTISAQQTFVLLHGIQTKKDIPIRMQPQASTFLICYDLFCWCCNGKIEITL